jgi:hypothetical protein
LFRYFSERTIDLARTSQGWSCGCTRIDRVVSEPGVRTRLYGRRYRSSRAAFSISDPG